MTEDKPVQPAMVMTTPQTHDDGGSVPLAGGKKTLGDIQLYGILMVTSFIEFVAGTRHCSTSRFCNKEYLFAVFLGLISTLICFSFIVATRFKGIKVSDKSLEGLAIFFLVWWTLGAGVCTFRGPFNSTSNGYFACWLSYLISLYITYTSVAKFRALCTNVNNRRKGVSQADLVVLIVFVASGIELIEAATLCDKYQDCTGRLGWAVSVGTISAFFSLIHLLPPLKPFIQPFKFHSAVIVAGFWIPGAGIMTFTGPFEDTGNGYFAAWIALFASLYWAFEEIKVKYPAIVNLQSDKSPPV
jgi:hypothetical protein